MGRFLDQRSSMNASGPISVPVGAPALFGIVGLQTENIAGNGGLAGGLIVDLAGNISLTSVGGPAAVDITVVRGAAVGGTTFYTQRVTFETGDTSKYVAFNAQDLNAPASIETAYSTFVSLVSGAVTRVGPETFWGIASQG